MKFEEQNEDLILPNIQESLVYLLLDKEEVVYVGQSKSGMTRAYSHRDKVFTNIAIFFCDENELERKATDYIRKYKPKYNKNVGCDLSFKKAKDIIKNSGIPFNIYDLRKTIKKLGIETYEFNGLLYITHDDFEKIFQYAKDNKKI